MHNFRAYGTRVCLPNETCTISWTTGFHHNNQQSTRPDYWESWPIYLPSPVFAHGQLYLGLLRGKGMEDVGVLRTNTGEQGHLLESRVADNDEQNEVFTESVVYAELFLYSKLAIICHYTYPYFIFVLNSEQLVFV